MRKLFYPSVLVVFLWSPTLVEAETLGKQEVLQRALQNSPAYSAVLAAIDAADGSRLQASLRPNPAATFEIENFAGEAGNENFEGAELTLSIEQMIETAGKRSNRTDVAGFAYKIRQQQAKAQALKLLADAEYAFIRLAVAQKRLVLSDKRLDLAGKTHSIVKKRVGAAKAADIQHTKVDIEQVAAEVKKRKAQKELVTAQADLARLLGVVDASGLDVETDLSALPDLVEKQALLDALKDAPQYKAQKFAKMQAQSSLELAHSAAIPNPILGVGVRRFNQNDSTALVASLSFPIPVFNRNQGSIAAAKANIIKVDAQSYEAGLSLRQSAVQAWENLASSLEETSRYQVEIIPSARKAYSQADDGYVRGAFTFLDLLDAQRTLYEVQEAHLDSLLSIYEAKAQTDFLMGTHNSLIKKLTHAAIEGKTND